MKIDVAGVLIDNVSKQEAIDTIDKFVRSGNPHLVITPYSELIVFAQNDSDYRNILNQADLSLPDGIGVIWAAKYLSLKSHNIFTALFQVIYTGAAIIFKPDYIRSVITQQISGNEFVFDIAELAQEKKYSIVMVGGQSKVAAQASYELKKIFPDLKINLALSGRPFDEKIIREISDSNSDILLIAYSPPKQEFWLAQNLKNLNAKVAVGLGGTFDYLAKIHPSPPSFLRQIGLQWLWRLFTQPWRLKRMWNAVPVFVWKVYKYKVNNQNG
jgi:N-acetylglucosaminyldiphosphoundecaprenol N-acetyl-beta-D-mannosaminyltransferase